MRGFPPFVQTRLNRTREAEAKESRKGPKPAFHMENVDADLECVVPHSKFLKFFSLGGGRLCGVWLYSQRFSSRSYVRCVAHDRDVMYGVCGTT